MSRRTSSSSRGAWLFAVLALTAFGCGFPDSRQGHVETGDDAAVSTDMARSACPGVDTDTDPKNCGDCGHKCGSGELCAYGQCQCIGGGSCGAGTTCCTSGCRNLTNDARNCGACGNSCADSGEGCFDSACGCGAANQHCTVPSVCCGPTCVDVRSDSKNCGVCGNVCPNGGSCTNGACDGGGGGGGGNGCNPPCPAGQFCIPFIMQCF